VTTDDLVEFYIIGTWYLELHKSLSYLFISINEKNISTASLIGRLIIHINNDHLLVRFQNLHSRAKIQKGIRHKKK